MGSKEDQEQDTDEKTFRHKEKLTNTKSVIQRSNRLQDKD